MITQLRLWIADIFLEWAFIIIPKNTKEAACLCWAFKQYFNLLKAEEAASSTLQKLNN